MIVTGHSEKNADYYSDIYRRGYDTSGYGPLYKLVMKMLGNFPAPRILELGCGIGDLGKMIVDEGYPYRGFDFSEEAVKQARQRCPSGNFFIGDIYAPRNYEPVDYNVVIALEVLEHVDDIQVIENIPGGARFIASVPDYDDISHLRLYSDPKRDIVDRFRPYLHVVEMATATSRPDHKDRPQSIHIFSGIKLIK
jgi:SAM-dependent methyltransferase